LFFISNTYFLEVRMSYIDGMTDIWEMVKKSFCDTLPQVSVDLWFTPLTIESYENDVITFSTDRPITYKVVQEKYIGMMENGFRNVLGFDITVKVIFVGEPSDPEKLKQQFMGNIQKELAEEKKEQEKTLTEAEQKAKASQNYNFEYTFDNFIVGSSNKFAHAACTAVADRPAMDYNPLFIYGPSGLGKTHLMSAVVNEIKKKKPDIKVVYIKGDDFTNELIESLSKQEMKKFRQRYRSCDILLIDDIQFIAGKTSTQEEFFHTFNALYEEHKQIILSSDRPPKDIQTLEDRLKTRFEWGLIADIQPPDLELRIAIIKKKAEQIRIDVSDEVLEFLAENLRSNIRQIEGAVRKLSAKSFLTGSTITMETAKSCLVELLGGEEPVNVTVDKIFTAVYQKYGISKEDIIGPKRNKEIAFARHVTVYLIRKITEISLPNIGKIMGGRDHATVMSSISAIEKKLINDPVFAIDLDELTKDVTG